MFTLLWHEVNRYAARTDRTVHSLEAAASLNYTYTKSCVVVWDKGSTEQGQTDGNKDVRASICCRLEWIIAYISVTYGRISFIVFNKSCGGSNM